MNSKFTHMSEDMIPEQIWKALSEFHEIGLDEIPRETLMERLDRKYTISIDQVGSSISGLSEHYNIVKAAGSVVAPYRSLYLDTPEFEYFHKHRRGFGNRTKVRYRTYPKTDTSFIEVKAKSNKGRTRKERIRVENFDYPLPTQTSGFLKNLIDQDELKSLNLSVEIEYDRLGFIAKEGDERFSVDFDIRARYKGKEVSFGDLAVIEVKQDKMNTSPIIKQLRALGIRKASMSKYCMALSLLKPELKSNTFKASIHRLRKIDKETIYEV